MGGDHTCYTCGRLVGTPHTETCPRAAWGETVLAGQESHFWRPTEEQEAERIARNAERASLGETEQPPAWEQKMEAMQPPGTPITFDPSSAPRNLTGDGRERMLGIIRRSMAHDGVEAWGPEQVLAFAEGFTAKPVGVEEMRTKYGTALGLLLSADAVHAAHEALRDVVAVGMEPDPTAVRHALEAAKAKVYELTGIRPSSGPDDLDDPKVPMEYGATEEAQALLEAAQNPAEFFRRFEQVSAQWRRYTLPLVCGCGKTRAGESARGRYGCPHCETPFGDDDERRPPASEAAQARVRVREAQIEALMPYIDIRGPGEPQETLLRATQRALDAVQDAALAVALPDSIADAVSEALLPHFAEACEPRTLPTRIRDAAAVDVLSLLWERGLLVAQEDEWPAVHYCRSSLAELRTILATVLDHEGGRDDVVVCPDCLHELREAKERVLRTLDETRFGMEGVPALPDRTMADGRAPDLVSRMIDARECLRADGYRTSAVQGALRWLAEGIAEGMAQRELYGALRTLVEGEPHVCTCGHEEPRVVVDPENPANETTAGGCDGCSPGFEDRCRFEKALRTLLGVEASS